MKETANASRRAMELARLADEGDADAMCNLGMLYWDGDGVPMDREKAHALWDKADETRRQNVWTWIHAYAETETEK